MTQTANQPHRFTKAEYYMSPLAAPANRVRARDLLP